MVTDYFKITAGMLRGYTLITFPFVIVPDYALEESNGSKITLTWAYSNRKERISTSAHL